MSHYVYGVDIGGTNIKFGLFLYPEMNLVASHEIKTPISNHEISIFEDIAQAIRHINGQNNILFSDVLGLGMAVPCPVKNGHVHMCPNLYWKDISIHEQMKRYLPEHVQVAVSNDASIAALGENQSLEVPYSNAVFYTLGTGVGGGIIIDGKILEGRTGLGGEIGHMHVYEGETEVCGCGSRGCLEQICGTAGIFSYTRKLAKDEPTSINLEALSVKEVFDAAKHGDSVGLKVVHRVAEYVAISASVLGIVLDPDVFIIGGGVSRAGQFFLDLIVEHYQKHARFATHNVPFILAKTGNDAGFIGAAYLIKEKLN